MSITAYTGLPGSGKSYGVFQNVIIPALSQGIEVWTNIPFVSEKVMEEFGYQPILFDTNDIKENDNWFEEVLTPGAVIVIDELWRLWPSGLRANQIPEQHKSFLAEHRHIVGQNERSTEIVFVTQDLSQIANFARGLVETTYRSVCLEHVGQSNKFRIDIYQGAATGPNPPERQRIRQTFGTYSKKVYSYYKSHTKSVTGEAGKERKVDRRANILKSGKIVFIPFGIAAGCLFVLMFIGAFKTFFGGSEAEASVVKQNDGLTIGKTVKKEVVHIRQEIIDVFHNKSLSIVMNRGHYPNIDYTIRAEDGENHFTVTKDEMLKLGYVIRPIGDCLVNITVNIKDYLVTCQSPDRKQFLDMDFGAIGSDA